ncbi:MAG TPA: PLP-dependent transferase [Candidatus Saccharimonadales bacterium]|nr:PLP-dependent transferase [Candidatus Saccharimonadales bacterium]
MSSGPEFGELNPPVIIQEDPRACLSACLLSELPDSTKSESDVSRVLIDDMLYEEGFGTGLYPARELDNSTRKLGLSASYIYDAREPDIDEDTRVVERLAGIDRAIRNGQKVIVAFPKRREGEAPFLHYAVIKGFDEEKNGDGVVVLDPSDVDGGIERPSWEELKQYVTPSEDVPVMAWGISKAGKEEVATETIEEPGLPGSSLLAEPLWTAEDTGKAIPTGTDHPSSTAMPTFGISAQFNNLGGIVLSREGEYPKGYPRFVVPPQVKELSLGVFGHLNMLPFPNRASAQAAAHLENTYVQAGIESGGEGAGEITEQEGLFWLPATKFNLEGWQHTGLGISSRQAAAGLEGRPENDLVRREAAEHKIKVAITEQTGADPGDVYLFPTGMAGIYWLNQAMIRAYGSVPAVQFGFPYTDTYEQGKYGPAYNKNENLIDIRDGNYGSLRELVESGQQLRGVITEYPSNPLLATADMDRIDAILRGKAPIVVDDTIGTTFNLDDGKLPDGVAARVTSLTKFFSSTGDVMGGSVIMRPDSPHYKRLKRALDEIYTDTLWYEDAEKLAENSELFPGFMPVINANGESIARWLSEEQTGAGRPLENTYHPSVTDTEIYERYMKEDGGHGGLMTLRFNDPERAFRFYDALRVTKGPSLGTFYTLGCLYTYLAHKPLVSVKKFGVTPDLVRLSVGIEDAAELRSRFEEAFDSSAAG